MIFICGIINVTNCIKQGVLNMFKTKDGKIVNVSEKVESIVREVLATTKIYVWEYSEEPYQNPYNGRISYDRSGEVREATAYDINIILEEAQEPEGWHDSAFQQLLSELKTGNWQATYMSGCGKHWITFEDLIEDEYNEWKYKNFELYDEDGNELDEDLEMMLDEAFRIALNALNPEDYRGILMNDLPEFNLEETWEIFKLRSRGKQDDSLFKVFCEFWNKLSQLKGEKQLTYTTSEGNIRTYLDEYGFIEHNLPSTRGFVLELIGQLHQSDVAGLIIRQKFGETMDGQELHKVYGVRLGNRQIEYVDKSELRTVLTAPEEEEGIVEMVSGLK